MANVVKNENPAEIPALIKAVFQSETMPVAPKPTRVPKKVSPAMITLFTICSPLLLGQSKKLSSCSFFISSPSF